MEWILTPLAFLVANHLVGPTILFASACIAFHSVRKQVETSRKKATLDLIVKTESEEYFQRNYAEFRELSKRNELEALAKNTDRDDDEQSIKSTIDDFLNHYELTALSIRKGILDEGTYKEWMRSTLIAHYEASADYIQVVRDNPGKPGEYPDAYTEFENLAIAWRAGRNIISNRTRLEKLRAWAKHKT